MSKWSYKHTESGIVILNYNVQYDISLYNIFEDTQHLQHNITTFLYTIGNEIMEKHDDKEVFDILEMISRLMTDIIVLFKLRDNKTYLKSSNATVEDYNHIINLCTEVFVNHEPLCKSIGITEDEFKDGFRNLIIACCNSGFSTVIKDGDNISSICLAIPYMDYTIETMKPKSKSKSEPVNKIHDILSEIDNTPEDKEHTLYIFIVATDPNKQKSGHSKKLVKETFEIAKIRGYKYCLADTTNVKSYKLFTEHFAPYQELDKVFYKDQMITRVKCMI